MSTLSTRLNSTALHELCTMELRIAKSNGKKYCAGCSNLLIMDQLRFELKIKPKSGSLLKSTESFLFHIQCWLKEDNEYKFPFNYKTCVGWNKLKRTMQNDILRVNAGYISSYEKIQNTKHEIDAIEPPAKKRKLCDTNHKSKSIKVHNKKKNFKPPRTKKEKEFIQKRSVNLKQNRITNTTVSIHEEDESDDDDDGNEERVEIVTKPLTKNVGVQQRVSNIQPVDKGIQCNILYLKEQGTQTMAQHLDLDTFQPQANKTSHGNKSNNDILPWDAICSENKIETKDTDSKHC